MLYQKNCACYMPKGNGVYMLSSPVMKMYSSSANYSTSVSKELYKSPKSREVGMPGDYTPTE